MSTDDSRVIEWWAESYWRQIRRLHKAYANLRCVDETGSAMNYGGDVGPAECTCEFCRDREQSGAAAVSVERLARAVRVLTERNDGWPPTQRDLAVELNVGVGTVNAWAKKAEAQGLVERGGARGSQLRVKKRRTPNWYRGLFGEDA